ncbi:uncharacterized protein E0L32_008385 [Thyridium curvatum]|uniref:Uncharacterized protein n=1 Tax=Thyridium curvatum TaxID=1093900 RepID=A0A507B0L6_9PEZI|nr:uncharacterized protein E0L32_008385 [Thyridium curvatum]TPX10651.1 hypothetical protein E0L32_008385 [Thyridium curvatum]
MLRRQSTKSRSDPARRKSVSSGRSVCLEHLDADVALRDAHIAALHAYNQGTDRSAQAQRLFPVSLSRCHSSKETSTLSRSSSLATQAHRRFANTGATKVRSVRYVRSASQADQAKDEERRAYTPSTPREHDHCSENNNQVRDETHGHGMLKSPVCNLSKTSGANTVIKQHDTLILDNSQGDGADYYTPEDDIASQALSFRSLRRSQSMFTSHQKSLRSPNPGGVGHLKENRQPSTIFPASHADLDWPGQSPQDQASLFPLISKEPYEGEATCTASRLTPDSSLIPQPLRLASTTVQEPAKPLPPSAMMRKSLRSSSSNSAVPSFAGTGKSTIKRDGSLKIVARKASQSLKSKFRTLLGRPKTDLDTEPLQEQQTVALASIFDSEASSPASKRGEHPSDAGTVSNVQQNLVSLYSFPSTERLKSQQGLIGDISCGEPNSSYRDEESRATSWAGSSLVSAGHPWEESSDWQRQRLSVIDEHHNHCPSPSLQRQRRANLGTSPPATLAGCQAQIAAMPGATFDTQRLYSALMKKLDEGREPSRTRRPYAPSDALSNPFRTVSPTATNTSNNQGGSGASASTTPTIQKPSATDDGTRKDEGYENPNASCYHDPSLDSPSFHLFRTASSYRIALQESMQASEGAMRHEASPILTKSRSYSASEYSSHGTSESQAAAEIRSILQGFTKSPDMMRSKAEGQRDWHDRSIKKSDTAPGSSIDWQSWLTDNACSMELQSSPARSVRSSTTTQALLRIPKCRGHVREPAQISDESDGHDSSDFADDDPVLAATPLSIERATPWQPSLARLNMSTTTNLVENEAPSSISKDEMNGDASLPDSTPPPVPPRNPLRDLSSGVGNSLTIEESVQSTKKQYYHPRTPEDRLLAARRAKSLARLRSLKKLHAAGNDRNSAPTSASARLGGYAARALDGHGVGSTTSSPGLTTALQRQFGPRPHARLGKSQDRLADMSEEHRNDPGVDGQADACETTPSLQPPLGGQRIVDIFLSSRRKRMVSTDEGGTAFV